MNWPDPPGAGPLGDGRNASAADLPDSIEALAEAVARRAAEGLAIYPQGGKTSLDYGGIPARPGAAIATLGLAGVVDYPAADMTITVQAGMTLAALQAIVSAEGQRLTLDAPEPSRATLGGIFATNASGPRRFGSGRPRDQILGLRFVGGSGTILKGGGRVVKNVAGYDLPKLLTGSLGTLGIIAELTLKVRPKPEASAIAWMSAGSIESASTALDRLNTSKTRPMAIELLNPAGSRAVGGPIDLPGDAWTIAVGFEDNASSVAWQVGAIRDEMAGLLDVEILEGEAAAPAWSQLADAPAVAPGPIGVRTSVLPSAVAPLSATFDPARWAVFAQAGSGIVHASALGEISESEAAEVLARTRSMAARSGGSVVLTRAPADWKPRLGVWGEPRGDWALMAKVKRALDPAGVMNPGRFVDTIG